MSGATAERHAEDAPRRRGRPGRLTRAAIVAAARELAPDALTMQAVAESLDVDPKAINYHVGDRDNLLALIAFDVFTEELSGAALPEGSDWKDALRNYARALHHAAAQLGSLAHSIRLRDAASQSSLGFVDATLGKVHSAGFDTGEARRILVAISDIAFADVLDSTLVARHDTHPQLPDLLEATEGPAEEALPHLRRVLAHVQHHPRDTGQFDFHLEAVLAGLDRRSAEAG